MKKAYFFLFLLCTSFARAQQADTLATVEVTATRLLRSAVGQSKILLDSTALRSFGHGSLADALSELTPLAPRNYGIASSLLSVRGGATNHTAVVWNGINLQSAVSGYADASIFPVGIFSHVGVKLGGESALFGGGAVAGVVVLDNQVQNQPGWRGQVSATAGSFGEYNQMLKLSGGKKRVFIESTVLHNTAANDFPFKNTASLGAPEQRLENARSAGWHVLTHGLVHCTPKTTLNIHLWHLRTNRQIPPTMTTTNDFARQSDISWRGVLEMTHLNTLGTLRGRIAHIDDALEYRSQTVAPSAIKGQNQVIEVEQEGALFRQHSGRIGINFIQNKAISNNFSTAFWRRRFALFSAQTFDIQGTVLGINCRQEISDGKLVPFTWSAGVKRVLLKKEQYRLDLRSSFSRNYNLPALNDLYWTGLGNPDLRPERSWSGEIGTDLLHTATGSGWSKNISLTAFAMRVKDRIQWAPVSGAIWRPSNLPYAVSMGLESSGVLSYTNGKTNSALQLSYYFTHTADDNGYPLLYVPMHTAQATASFSRGNATVRWRQVASDGRAMTRDNSIRTQPYTLSNVEISLVRRMGIHQLHGIVMVQNLLNTAYQVIQYYPMPGRSFTVQVYWNL